MDHHLNEELVAALRVLHGGATTERAVETHEETRIRTLAEHAFSFLDAIAGRRRQPLAGRPADLPRLAA